MTWFEVDLFMGVSLCSCNGLGITYKRVLECSFKLSLLTSTVLGLGAYGPHKDINLKPEGFILVVILHCIGAYISVSNLFCNFLIYMHL